MSLQEELGLLTPFQDARHEAILNLVRTANLVSAVGAQLFRRVGLTEAQFNVLFALKFTTGEITQAELGKRLVVTRASITSVLDKLEAKGLVQRRKVPGNRRIHHVGLTERGEAAIREVEPIYREEIHRALADFTEEDCQRLIDYMQRARKRLSTITNGTRNEAAK